jgi:hypothetical protein
MIGPPTGDFHPIYNAPMLGAHKRLHSRPGYLGVFRMPVLGINLKVFYILWLMPPGG